jgi:hypothetical protein
MNFIKRIRNNTHRVASFLIALFLFGALFDIPHGSRSRGGVMSGVGVFIIIVVMVGIDYFLLFLHNQLLKRKNRNEE